MSGKAVSFCARIILLFMAAALLLPIYGSWVDFHYAGMQPNHKHIYLGKVNLNHHRVADAKDVVNLPDQDATSQPVISICLLEEELAAEIDDAGALSFGIAEDCLSPEDAFLPPPDPPPQA